MSDVLGLCVSSFRAYGGLELQGSGYRVLRV